MAYNYEYPYFDAGNYNSDWLIHKMKELEETVIGLETFKYIGENEILDLNQQKQNSIAAFTSNFNVLNAPISNVQRVTITYGSETAYIQQLYDLSNFTVYTRNYSTASGWTTWKLTQYAPGTIISTSEHLTTGDFNTLPDNKALFLYTNAMQHAPVDGYGYLLTWKSTNDGAKIQVFFSTDHGFIYLRGFSGTNWGKWVEANHIDLTPYIKAVPYMKSGDNINTLEKNRTTLATQDVANIPSHASFNILTLGPSDSNDQFQLAFQRNSNEIWLRPGNNGSWENLTRNYKVLHRSIETQNVNNISGGQYLTGYFSTPLSGYLYVQGVGIPGSTTDTYQIIMSSESRLFVRFRNNSTWYDRVEFQRVSSTRSLTITSTAEEHSTDDEGRDRYRMGDNLYAETAKTMDNTYISLPGQSLLHSEEGKQSFKDAILNADLSDIDVIMTNLEMWDMDIPLDTIVEEVSTLSDAITAKNPMCELTLLSIPPIDVPLWGDELLDHTMPNGSTLRQVDDRLFKLSEEHAFTYVSFDYFYHAQNTNLMKYHGRDFKTNKQYLRRVGTFIKRKM